MAVQTKSTALRPYRRSETILVVLIILGMLWARKTPLLQTYDLQTLDYRFLVRGTQLPHPDIVIIDIDEATLASEEGRVNLRRDKLASMVRWLHQAGAKAIYIDIIMTEPGVQGKWEDKAFAQAAREAGNVFLPMLGYEEAIAARAADQKALEKFNYNAAQLASNAKLGAFKTLLAPIDPLPHGIQGCGYPNVAPDPDGIYRRVSLLRRYGNYLVAHAALEVARFVLGIPKEQIAFDGKRTLYLGNHRILVDSYARMLINYTGPANTYLSFSWLQAAQGKVPPEMFQGKIVLIGSSALALFDIKPSPFSEVFSGVEQIATILDNLLSARFYTQTKTANAWLVIAYGVLVLVGLRFRSPRWAGIFAILLLLFHIWLAFLLFLKKNMVIEVVPQAFTILVAYALLGGVKLVAEEREKRWRQQALEAYLPHQVAQRLAANPQMLRLGGERKEITIMASDIWGFSSMSEKLDPAEVEAILNDYFTAMTDVAFRHGGTVDKFIGDGLMVLFNAPTDQPDHPLRAVLAALEMLEELEQLNQKWSKENRPQLVIGIGIHCGEAVVGNLGSQRRMQYSAIGDNVNIAFRIETLSRQYGTPIIISDAVYQAIAQEVECRLLDEVQVKGRVEPVRIYEVIGLKQKEPVPAAEAVR